MSKEKETNIPNIITKCYSASNGNIKVIDFRSKLNAASVDHYAMVHQEGGSKGLYPSLISMVLCNSSGSGGGSSTVSLNIEPSLPYEWLEVCKANLGSIVIPYSVHKGTKNPDGTWNNVQEENDIHLLMNSAYKMHYVTDAAARLCGYGMRYAYSILKKEVSPQSEASYNFWCHALKDVRSRLTKDRKKIKELTLSKHLDYSYSQDKINNYKQGPDGYVPVTQLRMNHTSRRDDGTDSKYPWYISITSFEAKLITQKNGAINYDGKTARKKEMCNILVSDRDMFRMMHRIVRYTELFEMAHCIPVIREGEKLQDAAYNKVAPQPVNQGGYQNNSQNYSPNSNGYAAQNNYQPDYVPMNNQNMWNGRYAQ